MALLAGGVFYKYLKPVILNYNNVVHPVLGMGYTDYFAAGMVTTIFCFIFTFCILKAEWFFWKTLNINKDKVEDNGERKNNKESTI